MAWASQVALVVKNLPANAGDITDVSLIPGLGRSPEGVHGNLLQYPWLENSHGWGARWATVHEAAESDMTKVTYHALMATWSIKTLKSTAFPSINCNYSSTPPTLLGNPYNESFLPYYLAIKLQFYKMWRKKKRKRKLGEWFVLLLLHFEKVLHGVAR